MRSLFIILGISALASSLQGQVHCGESDIVSFNRSLKSLKEHIPELNIVETRETLVIPVVVHIVSKFEDQNLSDEQIQSQIDVLNIDFAGFSVEDYVPSEFKDLVSDAGIRFCLASKDPNGLPTNGIIRVHTDIDFIGDRFNADGKKSIHYSRFGGSDGWNPSKYLNIWVCGIQQYLGYATRPGLALYPEEDGVVIGYKYFGNIERALNGYPHHLGRTATHEVGHYLGLKHIWGQDNVPCGDDMIADTPPQNGPNYGCPIGKQFSCDATTMYMNFMDYTDDACMYMFTKDQVSYMRSVLLDQRYGLANQNNTSCTPFLDDTSTLDEIKLVSTMVRDRIHINFGTLGIDNIEFKVFNLFGQLVLHHHQTLQNNVEFFLNKNIASGVYLLQLRTKQGTKTFKFIKI